MKIPLHMLSRNHEVSAKWNFARSKGRSQVKLGNVGSRMKTYPYTLFALCCALIGATASAQVTTARPTPPPLPPGPLIQKRAPDMAQWVITTTHPASGANSTSAPATDASADNESQAAGKP